MKGRQLSYEEVEKLPYGTKVWYKSFCFKGEVRMKVINQDNLRPALRSVNTRGFCEITKEAFHNLELKVYEWLEDTQEDTREELDTSKVLYVLEQKDKLKTVIFFSKLHEEVQELGEAFMNNDRENILEELLDIHQVLISLNAEIIKPSKDEMAEAVDKHNKKLLGRGYKFKGQALRVVD